MGTIADKLNLLLNTKAAIKAAIIGKGQSVADADPFASYPAKIEAIQTGIQLPTLTNPGAATDLLAGKQLIDQYGNPLTGTMPEVDVPTPTLTNNGGLITASVEQDAGHTPGGSKSGTLQLAVKTASDLTASGAAVTVPAGYYAADASKSVATAAQALPAISVSSEGLITVSATQAEGYVAGGPWSATKQLTTKAAATITPGTADQTIASGQYLTGVQTIKGDANLLAANIKSGVSIFGVAGALTSPNIVVEDCSNAISVDTSASTITITLAQSCSRLLGLNAQLADTSGKKAVHIAYPDYTDVNDTANSGLMYAGSTIFCLSLPMSINGNKLIFNYSSTTYTAVAIIEAADSFTASVIYLNN